MKAKSILPLNWHTVLEDIDTVSINNDIVLFDKPVIDSTFQYPFKVDVSVTVVCINGTLDGFINLKRYTTQKNCFITILPGQIMEHQSVSEDFSGLFIVMSPKFSDSLMPDAHERLPLFLSVRDNPVVHLDEEGLTGMIQYFEMLKRMAQEKEHPYRLEVARHLTLAFFYGASVNFHKFTNTRKKTHHEALVDKFLHLVQIHHKEERELEFYADKMSFTPKHLSKVVKETSGKSANNLIEQYVALEAKALMKSTNMTIQQISDELNFPSQSFFGKYFKRVTGMSPKEYKVSG